mmetsp:Transcript_10777/g.20005  ORF Transcript_10777/g.20005 Transcript_10777/m.20005 type:complete len:99 (+) Transcript_10777:83-379(+)
MHPHSLRAQQLAPNSFCLQWATALTQSSVFCCPSSGFSANCSKAASGVHVCDFGESEPEKSAVQFRFSHITATIFDSLTGGQPRCTDQGSEAPSGRRL